MSKTSNLPIIKSKKDAEIFLIFFLKNREFYITGLHIYYYFILFTDFSFRNSVKPFVFRAFNKRTKENEIFYTFTDAINWIFKNRTQINTKIYHCNINGWERNRNGKNTTFHPFLGDLINE